MKNASNSKIPRLFELMEENHVKGSDLTKMFGISSGNISNWKVGKNVPSARTLASIADYLGTTPEYILGKTDKKEKPTVDDDDELEKDVNELVKLTKNFSDEEFKAVLDYVDYLVAKRKNSD